MPRPSVLKKVERMSLLNVGEPSPAWPYIKAVAKFLKIPGTEIGLEPLTDLQDDLAQDQYQDQVKALIEVMSTNTMQILQILREQVDQQATEERLRAAAQDFAEWIYLKRTANKFFYADFKGIQESKFVPLPLDEIFVDLTAVPEDRESSRQDKERELRDELERADESRRAELIAALEENDIEQNQKQAPEEARTPGEMLKEPGPVVLLGGPGSGKTTLVKRLARSCSLGHAQLRERFPEMPWCFPVVVPVTQYVDGAKDHTILEYIEEFLRERGGEMLLARYREHFLNGRVLLLLDGLDEVAHASQRIAAAKAVDETAQSLGQNRLLVSSRRVGYAICRLSVPAAHYILCPFSPKDITTFVEHWYVAFEKSQKGDKADLAAARQTAKELNEEIRSNSSVASLATNPLMLTIIALIKHRSVELPHRRVELYRIALETLLDSWNLARSLAQTRNQRTAGETPRIEQTREVWSHIALWMHTEANREVSRERLHNKLVEVLVQECDKTEFDAQAIAGSYLDAAAETSGLLEARGANTYAFVHQSFQEYLAGYRLMRPATKACLRIKEHCPDPRWHEVIRLGVGHLSITVGEKEVVGDIVDELLNPDDPLEVYLCTSLRLALGCLADQVGLRQQQTDAIFIAVANRLHTTGKSETRRSMIEALEPVQARPGSAAQSELLKLTSDANWSVRKEGARLVGLGASLDAASMDALQDLFNNEKDLDVRAHAAWGLWQHGRKSEQIVSAIAYGLQSIHAPLITIPGGEFVPALIHLLEFRDVEMRIWAAQVLIKLGLEEKALPALVQLLEDPSHTLRTRVVQILGNLGPQEKALPAVVQLLENTDNDVQKRAAQVLGKWGPQETALPALVQLLEDPNAGLRRRAAQVLGNWGYQEKALPALIDLLENPATDVRRRAAQVLGNWGLQERTLSAFVHLLEDPDADVRLLAAHVLDAWGHQEKALPTLVQLLEDPNAGVRRRTAKALGKWGQRERALAALVRMLEDPDADARRRAAQVLGNWGHEEKALPALLRLLQDLDADIRRQAAGVLGNWEKQEKALAPMIQLLEDPDAQVRMLAAWALGNWGPHEKALPVLVRMLQDPDASGRRRAAQVLGNWGMHEKALPVLVQMLQDPDADVRRRSAWVLGKWGPQEKALVALGQLLDDRDADVRKRAVQVLSIWGQQEKAHGTALVARLILRELTDQSEPMLLKVFQIRNRAGNGFSDLKARAELSCLLAAQPDDTPRKQSLREILFDLVWHHCATTA